MARGDRAASPASTLDAALDAIERGRCTHMNGVPTMWIGHGEPTPASPQRDLSSLRMVSSGGAALPFDVGERFRALTGLRLGRRLGHDGNLARGHQRAAGPRRRSPGEIGVPLPGVEIGRRLPR